MSASLAHKKRWDSAWDEVLPFMDLMMIGGGSTVITTLPLASYVAISSVTLPSVATLAMLRFPKEHLVWHFPQ